MHIWRKTIALAFSTVLALSLSSCVNQHPAAPISAAEETRIIATSNATLKICDKLGLDLVAIPTTIGTVPERYQGLPEIGTAMEMCIRDRSYRCGYCGRWCPVFDDRRGNSQY